MALDLPSVLGGLAQGFLDFGKSTVDLLGTGTASVADLVQSGGKSTKNQDDFRKWLYKTGSVEDASAKGLGTALNGAQTIVDFIPPVSAITKTPLGNGLQGAVGGLADEFKEYGKDYDLARAGERAAISGGAAIASGGLSDALKGSANSLLSSGAIRGLASGGIAGGVTGGGYAAIDGGDILEGAKQGASMGALVGGATGLGQDFRPAKTYEIPLTEEEKALRVKTIDDQIANLDTSTPDGAARLNELTRARAVYDTAPENIQRLYHQTSANSFEEFSPEKRASGVMDQGTPTGIFLKENNNDIGLPGKNQLQFDVKMENPYQVDSRDALANYARSRSKTYADLYDQAVELDKKSADVYNEFTNKLDDVYKKYYYEQDATKKAALKKDVDYLIKNIKSLSEEKASEYRRQGADVARKAQEELNRVLREDGYDSVILANDEGSFGRKIKSYIALSPYEQMAEIKKMPLEQTLSVDDMTVNQPNTQARIANAQKQIEDIGPVSMFSKNPDDIAKRARNNYADNRQAQFELLQKTNPMRDDYHTGIRSPEEIYTLKNIVDSYNEDNNFTYPDFTLADAQKAIANGSIDVYGSKPIEPGAFATPSKMMATDYAGGGEIYTKNIPLEDFAFIESGDEGNYLPLSKNKTLDATLSASENAINDKYSDLIKKAKNYKSLDRFEKMNNPIKGSEIWGEKPTSVFQRDSRAVRINMFPNDATKGTGITKQYLLNMFKDAYDDGITDIVPSYGSYTKEGASFMDHLADQGWVKQNGNGGWKSYEIAPKIAEWKKTTPLADIYNEAHGLNKTLETTLAASEDAINSAKLSPEQEAFFKGSAIRDADGNLMPVYHSSPNKFTAFDDSRLGQNTMYDNTGYGHFVTTDQDFSRRFRDINNTGVEGNTMELYADVKNPITHPYGAHYKYSGDDLEKILVDYYNAIENPDAITALKEYATENGTNMYDEYMSLLMGGESPFENVPGERDALKRAGYDAVEFVEGLKKDLVDGSTDDTPISSYAVFSGNKLKDINNLSPTENPDIRYSKAAPDQSLEKTLANGDAEINRVGSANVAPVDPDTLPESIRAAKGFLNKDYIKDIENYSGKKIENMTDSELIEYALSKKPEQDREVLREAYSDIMKGGTTARDVAESVAKNAYLYKIGESDFSDGGAGGVMDYLLHHGAQLREGRTKAADIELSDRLGIAPSNTFMRDNANPYDSYGSYDPSSTTISIGDNTVGENAIGTVGHERLHSFQVESLLDRYDKEVLDAYKDLSKDLDKYIKTDAEIAKLHADDPTDLAYWGNKDEQQARMFQQYLENKNFTKTGSIRNRAKEWGNEINPAFDKFINKLRDLSKRGVALPALATLFGGGAYMANQGQEKDKDKEEVL